MSTTSAVLLITFNRPEAARLVLERIREYQPSALYFFNDAPRANYPGDKEAREVIRRLTELVDWPCEVHLNFPETNRGCGYGPASAISWAFEQEDKLIILEDDCVPEQSFFVFCNEMLERYASNKDIWMISGNNYHEEYPLTTSYTFSRSAIHIYGWATWKHCWNHFDMRMHRWPEFIQKGGFRTVFSEKKHARFWAKKYDKIIKNLDEVTKTVWDYQFLFMIFNHSGLAVVPEKNLVRNIGYIGTHNNNKNQSHDRKTDAHFRISHHPEHVHPDESYDAHHMEQYWMKKRPLYIRLKRKVQKLFR